MKQFMPSLLNLSSISILVLVTSLSFSAVSFAAATDRVSLTTGGMEANSDSFNAAVSDNGRFVAFDSDADNLVADDSNAAMDIFVRDLTRGTTTRVSINSAGEQGNGWSSNAAISADGRFVVFESTASNLVTDDTNGTADIFLHDRDTGTTERISYSDDFGQTSMDSHAPAISANGRYITYYSFANNLVAEDNNDSDDIFVYDRIQAITERISVNNANIEGNGASYFPHISANGRYVSFASTADNLVPNDTNGRYDVFLFDRTTRAMERISVNNEGIEANNHSFFSSVSEDGRYVVFESSAANLSPNDVNRRTDIFLRDRAYQTTQRISLYSDGTSPMGSSASPKINSAGNFVVFASVVDLLIGTDTNFREDVYLYDISMNALELVSVDSDDNIANAGSAKPSISADGRMVAFQSMATDLVPGDTNAREDIFIRDRAPNLPPIADAGQDLNVYLGDSVTLDGSASFDPDGDLLVEYTWRIELAPANSNAALSSADTSITTLMPDAVGEYVVSLTVGDGRSTSIADEIFIRVIENLPPIAVILATPVSGIAPLTVQFDGTGSHDPENAPLSYAWDFGIAGSGSDLVTTAFTYTIPGTYTVVLTVQDDFGNLAEDVIEIVVSAVNEPPTVAPYTATPAQGPAPLKVSFVANASDPDGDHLSYFWEFGDGTNSTQENPEHIFYYPGSYSVSISVSDGEFTTSAQVFVAVESLLTIEEIEAELDWERRKRDSKLKLEIKLSGLEPQQVDDRVRVVFGELVLLDVLFSDFETKESGEYIHKDRHVYAKLDYNNRTLKISNRLQTNSVELGQAVPVMVNIGDAMAIDQVTLTLEEDHRYDRKIHHKHAKFCKRKSRH